MDQTTLNNNMIDGQIRPINGISKEVISAFSSVNRSDFVPEDLILRSYTEKNLKLSSDRYLLRPNLIGEIINHVSPQSNESILVLPASTGYSSAIISNLAETVIAVEEDDNVKNAIYRIFDPNDSFGKRATGQVTKRPQNSVTKRFGGRLQIDIAEVNRIKMILRNAESASGYSGYVQAIKDTIFGI